MGLTHSGDKYCAFRGAEAEFVETRRGAVAPIDFGLCLLDVVTIATADLNPLHSEEITRCSVQIYGEMWPGALSRYSSAQWEVVPLLHNRIPWREQT